MLKSCLCGKPMPCITNWEKAPLARMKNEYPHIYLLAMFIVHGQFLLRFIVSHGFVLNAMDF